MPTPHTPAPTRTLRARYVFPVAGEPIADGLVTIEDGRIVALGKASKKIHSVEDLGNVALLPGLVNAHTHLDLSDLERPLGEPGIGFVDWIGRVMDHRRNRPAGNPIERGLRESIRAGTTVLGDIALPEVAQPDGTQSGESADATSAPPLDLTRFLELIGPTPDRAAEAIALAEQFLGDISARGATAGLPSEMERGATAGLSSSAMPRSAIHTAGQASSGTQVQLHGSSLPHCHRGLCPHAPYSVHPDLLSAAVRLSAAQRVPLAFHLAESREELQLLRSASGPLRQRLKEIGAWNSDLVRPGTRPLDYLRQLDAAHRSLVIHGNYLDDEEIGFVARRRERMALVYCPRTHAHFRHDRYPLHEALAAGATVALGTDSRASSPDLSLLAEMRTVARCFPEIEPAAILRLGTLNGARALGRDGELGSLEPGKRADLAVVPLPDRDAADPHDLLFDGRLPVVATWYRGVVSR